MYKIIIFHKWTDTSFKNYIKQKHKSLNFMEYIDQKID